MNNQKKLITYWLSSLIISLALSAYPLYMGIKVLHDMVTCGTVAASDYPKYIIPYTPISLAFIFSVLLLPVAVKLFGRFSKLVMSVLSVGAFLFFEIILESKVIVTDTVATKLESWQMFMCYVSPEAYETRTWTPVDVLIGEYSPSFKLHFYAISIILVIALVNIFYGFADVVIKRKYKMIKPLVLFSAVTLLFLGLCIFACFTAFFRTGELNVSPISAILMAAFFISMGLVAGVFTIICFPNKSRFGMIISGLAASLVTVLMYVGEALLLSGNLYRFGSGFLFNGLGAFVLAPVDILIILTSGIVSALLYRFLKKGDE